MYCENSGQKQIVCAKPLDKSVLIKIQLSYFSIKIYFVGTQKNSLNETVLLSTQNKYLN